MVNLKILTKLYEVDGCDRRSVVLAFIDRPDGYKFAHSGDVGCGYRRLRA